MTDYRRASPRFASGDRRRPDWATGLRQVGPAVALVLVFAWFVSGFAMAVADRTPRGRFVAPLSNQMWLAAPVSGNHSFFRADFYVGAAPDRAIIWLQGDQRATVYVDGLRVAASATSINSFVDTALDLHQGVIAVDLTPMMTAGRHTLGVEVTSGGNVDPAIRARLELVDRSATTVVGVRPDEWKVTDDVQLTGQHLATSGSFAIPTLNESGWLQPRPTNPRYSDDTLDLPAPAYDRPLDGAGAVLTGVGVPTSAAMDLDVPAGAKAVWLRVGAGGPFEVDLDGHLLASQSVPVGYAGTPSPFTSKSLTDPSTTYLYVYDLTGTSAGRHQLTMTAASVRPTGLYADASADVGGAVSDIVAPGGWRSPSSATQQLLSSPTAASVLQPLQLRAGNTGAPAAARTVRHVIYFLFLSALAVGLGAAVALIRRTPALAEIRAVGRGTLPATGLLLLASQLGHLVTVQAPFPTTPGYLQTVAAVAVVGVAFEMLRLGRPLLDRLSSAGARLREWRPADFWTPARLTTGAVILIGLVVGGANLYDLGFEPPWQDELSSLAAAQGMQQHVLPIWPSGFIYFKSELYTATIAMLGALTHNSIAWLRAESVFWFAATIVAFGLLIAPWVSKGRRWVQVATTLLYATAPYVAGHARDIRMYQMAAFLVTLVAWLLHRALETQSPRLIRWLAVATLAMYFTHEETFIVLPAMAVAGLWAVGWRPFLTRFWIGPLAVVSLVVAAQLMAVKLTHPPAFGADSSGGPLIAWTPTPFYYLSHFFFVNTNEGATVTVVSWLALVAIMNGVRRQDRIRAYLAIWWLVPLVVVSIVLPAKDTRYCFVLLPFVFALGVAGGMDILDGAGRWAYGLEAGQPRILGHLAGVICFVALAVSTIGSPSDYGLLAARLGGTPVYVLNQDYRSADQYVKSHLGPGDIVIASGTANLTGYGIGRAPDYWLPFRRGSRLLFEILEHGQAVDTQYGAPVINNAAQLQDVLDTGHRVWLVLGDRYTSGLLQTQQEIISTELQYVYENADVSVYVAN